MSHHHAFPPSGTSDRAILDSDANSLEARFRRIEQNLPCVIYEYESDETGLGRFVYFTPQWQDLTELPVDLTIADVNLALGVIHPEDLGEFLRQNEYAARTLSVLDIEVRILTPSGKLKWVAIKSSPQAKNPQGLILWNGMMVDVTNEKVAQEALRASTARFDQMAATVPSGLYEYVMYADGSSEYLYLSPRAEEIYEVRPGELQKNINVLWNMVHPDDLDALRKADVGCNQRNELFVSEFRIIPRSGKTKWVRLASLPNPAVSGQPVVWSGYVIDITDQKLLEARSVALYQTIPDLVLVIDEDGRYIETNNSNYLELFFPKDINIVGLTFYDIFPVDVAQSFHGSVSDALRSKESIFFEYPLTALDGQIYFFESRSVALRETAKGKRLTLWVIRDITDRKKAEQLILEQRISESRLQERTLLIQDMHDGFGSQLTSARLQVEEGELHQSQLAELLRECMADLHMVVDTLGNDEGLLSEAFHHLRQRSQKRLAGQPFALEWSIQLEGLPPLPPREILNILRIVQEAINNAVKHARASTIGVKAIHHGHNLLSIEVHDDGVGFPQGSIYGKGLHNLHSRAQNLGADLKLIDMHPGLKVVLQFKLNPRVA
jgi:PAS domain S-box-containing protein